MATIRRFEELEIWQQAREFCKQIYPYTCRGDFARDYKLKNQLNDSSGSIMDNIAEGFERGGKNEFIQFLSISRGSCGEAMSQLYRAFDRNYLNEEELHPLIVIGELISNKIGNFMNYLNSSDYQGIKFKDRK